MRKAPAFVVAAVFAFTSQVAFAQSTRNISPSPNNIDPVPGPVYGQSCPPGYITQITQDQWGRTIGIACVSPKPGLQQTIVGGIVETVIGKVLGGKFPNN